jgi:transposase IS116/IS110/IS902 family protein
MWPGHHESAGKRLSGKTRKGSRGLRQVLVEMAHVAAKTTKTYLAGEYQRIAARRGKKRALLAVRRTLLVMVYHLLTGSNPIRTWARPPLTNWSNTVSNSGWCGAWSVWDTGYLDSQVWPDAVLRPSFSAEYLC